MNNFLYDNDYAYDADRWLDICLGITDYNVRHENEQLNNIQNDIIKNNDAALACFFSFDFNYKLYKMQNVIIKSKDPKYAFLFAKNVKNADIQTLQNIVLKSKNIKYITKFACFVKGANKTKAANILIKQDKSQAKWMHTFIKYVPNANIDKFKEAIFASKKPRYLFELAKHLTSKKEIAKIEDILIEQKSFMYIRLMARDIKLANIEKLEQAVLDTGNAKEIKKFALTIKQSKIRDLAALF